ncbi:DUF3253 domain-containing protein [uncultured Arthrobacter sp.]|uniref:DUF3253 domain-containing protein n=1 Tax=uncultured Arthrobacter sp. TaxID=114050 RepID=UPI00262A2F2F|nr:DUF3253 domain-containing protein [uncultured Arthrobacter sp.]
MTSEPVPGALRAEILRMAEYRGQGKTLCPSEAARSIGGPQWRELMPAARRISFDLAGAGLVEVTQGGDPVDADARGPIRIRWVETGRSDGPGGAPAR